MSSHTPVMKGALDQCSDIFIQSKKISYELVPFYDFSLNTKIEACCFNKGLKFQIPQYHEEIPAMCSRIAGFFHESKRFLRYGTNTCGKRASFRNQFFKILNFKFHVACALDELYLLFFAGCVSKGWTNHHFFCWEQCLTLTTVGPQSRDKGDHY